MYASIVDEGKYSKSVSCLAIGPVRPLNVENQRLTKPYARTIDQIGHRSNLQLSLTPSVSVLALLTILMLTSPQSGQ